MRLFRLVLPSFFILGSYSFCAHAQTDLRGLEEQLEILKDEVEVLQDQLEEVNQNNFNQMTISGYTDIEYHESSKTDAEPGFRLHHLSLFFEKRITDKWKFFSEIEYEDAPKFESEGDKDANGGAVFKDHYGKIYVESVNFSYFFNPMLNFRGGRFFTPAGIWSVDHYPTFVPTQIRPEHIRSIFPQVVDGVMLYGTAPMGNTFLNYDLYFGNGEKTSGKSDNNSEKASGIKLAFLLPMLKYFEIGASGYQDTLLDGTDKLAIGSHLKLKFSKFTLQGEYAKATFDRTDGTSDGRVGYYGQFQFDTQHWTLGVRQDYYDEDDTDNNDRTAASGFVNYHVNDSIVIKLEHHVVDYKDDTSDEDYNHSIGSVVIYLGN